MRSVIIQPTFTNCDHASFATYVLSDESVQCLQVSVGPAFILVEVRRACWMAAHSGIQVCRFKINTFSNYIHLLPTVLFRQIEYILGLMQATTGDNHTSNPSNAGAFEHGLKIVYKTCYISLKQKI